MVHTLPRMASRCNGDTCLCTSRTFAKYLNVKGLALAYDFRNGVPARQPPSIPNARGIYQFWPCSQVCVSSMGASARLQCLPKNHIGSCTVLTNVDPRKKVGKRFDHGPGAQDMKANGWAILHEDWLKARDFTQG